MKPAVLSQATDKVDALGHHRETHSFKPFNFEKEEKVTGRKFGSKNSKGLPGYRLKVQK